MADETEEKPQSQNVDFELQKIQNDLDAYIKRGVIPEVLTSRKFLLQYNSIYHCIHDWAVKLNMADDSVWSELTDDYVAMARQSELENAADILKQLNYEVVAFFKFMLCKTYKMLTTVIKGDPQYDSHIFSLAKELEFIVPKIRHGYTLTKMEQFKVSLFITHQVGIMENINHDLRKINDIIIRYKPYGYLTWSESMFLCLQFRSNLDHMLQVYVTAGEVINANLPYNQR